MLVLVASNFYALSWLLIKPDEEPLKFSSC